MHTEVVGSFFFLDVGFCFSDSLTWIQMRNTDDIIQVPDTDFKIQNLSVCDSVSDQNPFILHPITLKKRINNNHKGKHIFCIWKIHCLNTEENKYYN